MRASHAVGQDRQILTCLRSGDRKLQALIGSIDIKVLTDLKMSRRCIQSRFPNAPPPSNPLRVLLTRPNIRKATSLQVRRTCMSIARRTEKNLRSVRTLMSADSVGGDRLILTRLRSGDRKLQRWRFVCSCPICAREIVRPPSVSQDRPILTRRSQTTDVGQLHRLAAYLRRIPRPVCIPTIFQRINQ